MKVKLTGIVVMALLMMVTTGVLAGFQHGQKGRRHRSERRFEECRQGH